MLCVGEGWWASRAPKPPGAAPITFHRDSAYFDFDPPEVTTVWVALDDMSREVGPLEYVVGSHLWGDGRIGSAHQFFDGKKHGSGRFALLHDAARREGIDDPETALQIERCARRKNRAREPL